MQQAYKIVECENGNYKTLFHGLNGTRILPHETWLEADEKICTDGSKGSTEYLSGWHVLLTREDAEDYLKAFTSRLDILKIVPVLVDEIRPKEHSRSPVYLAKRMFVPTEER